MKFGIQRHKINNATHDRLNAGNNVQRITKSVLYKT